MCWAVMVHWFRSMPSKKDIPDVYSEMSFNLRCEVEPQFYVEVDL